jgi:hypothetical protein
VALHCPQTREGLALLLQAFLQAATARSTQQASGLTQLHQPQMLLHQQQMPGLLQTAAALQAATRGG